MIKGLAITPPIIGRISIGRTVEKNGKRLPEKDNQFTVTSQVQQKGQWLPHPIDKQLREMSNNDDSNKLRTLPIRFLFNKPELNLRASYSMFDRKSGRPICTGNGDKCHRAKQENIEQLDCPTPNFCQYGKGQCKPYGRLYTLIEGEDSTGTFIFRTTGFNSIRTLTARLHYFSALSNGLLAYLPLSLRLRGKSTTQSHRTPIYYADITLRDGMSIDEAITEAKMLKHKLDDAGLNQQALDETAELGFNNALLDGEEDDAEEIVAEFYSEAGGSEKVDATVIDQSKLRDSLKGLTNIATNT